MQRNAMQVPVIQVALPADRFPVQAAASTDGCVCKGFSTNLKFKGRSEAGLRIRNLAQTSFIICQSGIQVKNLRYLQSPVGSQNSRCGKTLKCANVRGSFPANNVSDLLSLQVDRPHFRQTPENDPAKKRPGKSPKRGIETSVGNTPEESFEAVKSRRLHNPQSAKKASSRNGATIDRVYANGPANFQALQRAHERGGSSKYKQEEKKIESEELKGFSNLASSDVTWMDGAPAQEHTSHELPILQGKESLMQGDMPGAMQINSEGINPAEKSYSARNAKQRRMISVSEDLSVKSEESDHASGHLEDGNLGRREGNIDFNSQADGVWTPREQKAVDYNGERVIEQKRKGRVVKRYKPLGIEYLYGRTKPTRLYGPLNSRGEVPGSGLAPVPKPYRDRCEHQQGWTIKEVATKILELNHWEDIDLVLNNWIGRYNRKNFPPLMAVMTSTGTLKHSARLFTWMKAQRCYRARNDIYNLLIWLYARHNRVDRVRSLYKEMQEWRCKPDLETYNALINVHGRVQQWKESFLYFDRMLRASVPPSTSTYNNLISACGNSGQWQKALELYKRMKVDGVEIDIVTHNAVVTALKIGRQYAMAIAHFERTLRWEVQPDCITLNIIISCLSKIDKHDEAIQLFNSMRSMKWNGCEPNLVTFTTIMHVYAACGQVENVKSVFEVMIKEGIVPNLVSYNTLLGAYASRGMDAEACEVFDAIQNAGFEPDIVTYTALMNAFRKSGKPDEAFRIFDLLKRRSRKPNILAYNTLIDAYSSAGRVTEALSLLPDMDYDDVSPTVVTICSLVVGCGRSGRVDKVLDVLQTASLRKIQLNVNVYNTILSLYLNEGMFEKANKILSTMRQEGITQDAVTFSILIIAATKSGNISQARCHFDDMLALGIDANVEAYSALIHGFAEQGRHEDARALLTRMKQSGLTPNVRTYTSLMHAHRTAEMPESAIAVFEEMVATHVEPDAVACSELFAALNSCHQPQNCLLQWRRWRGVVDLGVAAYRELTKACSVSKSWTTALELFEEMHNAGVTSDLTIENNILRSLCKGGHIPGKIQMLEKLQSSGMSPAKETLITLIDGYWKSGNGKELSEV